MSVRRRWAPVRGALSSVLWWWWWWFWRCRHSAGGMCTLQSHTGLQRAVLDSRTASRSGPWTVSVCLEEDQRIVLRQNVRDAVYLLAQRWTEQRGRLRLESATSVSAAAREMYAALPRDAVLVERRRLWNPDLLHLRSGHLIHPPGGCLSDSCSRLRY